MAPKPVAEVEQAPAESSDESSSEEDDSSEEESSSSGDGRAAAPQAAEDNDDESRALMAKALAYLWRQQHMRGFASWQAHVDAIRALRAAVSRLQRRELSKCMANWSDAWHGRRQALAHIRGAVQHLVHADLARALRRWQAEREDALARRRGLTHMVQHGTAKCFHTWLSYSHERAEQLRRLRQSVRYMTDTELARALTSWRAVALSEKKQRRLRRLVRHSVIGGLLLLVSLVWLLQALQWWSSLQPHPPPPPPPALPAIVVVPLVPNYVGPQSPHLKIWRPLLPVLGLLLIGSLSLLAATLHMHRFRWGWFDGDAGGDGGGARMGRHALVSSSDVDTQTPNRESTSVALPFEPDEDAAMAPSERSPVQLDAPPCLPPQVASPPRAFGGGLLDVYTQTPARDTADAQTAPESGAESGADGDGALVGTTDVRVLAAAAAAAAAQQPIHVHVHMHGTDAATSPTRVVADDETHVQPPPPETPPPRTHAAEQRRPVYGTIPKRSPRRPTRGTGGQEMY